MSYGRRFCEGILYACLGAAAAKAGAPPADAVKLGGKYDVVAVAFEGDAPLWSSFQGRADVAGDLMLTVKPHTTAQIKVPALADPQGPAYTGAHKADPTKAAPNPPTDQELVIRIRMEKLGQCMNAVDRTAEVIAAHNNVVQIVDQDPEYVDPDKNILGDEHWRVHPGGIEADFVAASGGVPASVDVKGYGSLSPGTYLEVLQAVYDGGSDLFTGLPRNRGHIRTTLRRAGQKGNEAHKADILIPDRTSRETGVRLSQYLTGRVISAKKPSNQIGNRHTIDARELNHVFRWNPKNRQAGN